MFSDHASESRAAFRAREGSVTRWLRALVTAKVRLNSVSSIDARNTPQADSSAVSLSSQSSPLNRFLKCIALTVLCVSTVSAAESRPNLRDAPLAARSGPQGNTLFTSLPSNQTGVIADNSYADPRMWGELYQELTFGAIGTGVAIGDYDADGRPDIFAVSKSGPSRLFRNLGAWKFEDVTDKAGLGVATGLWSESVATIKRWFESEEGPDRSSGSPWTQGATFVDVNNDGRLDLYVCRFAAPNLLYINQGDGTFTEEAEVRGLAVIDASGMAAFCDYDRDGWLDVYVQTNMLDAAKHPNGQRDYLLRNNGDGNFTDTTDAAGVRGETAGHSVTWWDFDNDGWPDIYVANDFAVPDSLYRNNRDGTFTDAAKQALPHVPFYAMGSDLGDVNNDGLIDLFVADMAATSHEKDQRGMAGSRTTNKENPENASRVPQYMRNALFLNTDTGKFLEAATMAGVSTTDWTWSVRLEDFDNDGRIDLFVTNGMNREYHNADILDRIMGGENRDEQRRLIRGTPVFAEPNLAFRNRGDLDFENVSAAWGLDHRGVSFGSATGDLDGDGDLDLVYANYDDGLSVLRNDAAEGHRITIALRGTRSNRFGVGAVVRLETEAGVQVRQLVLARGYLSSSEPQLHFGLGGAERLRRLSVIWPNGHVQTFADLPVNRHFTITEDAPTNNVEQMSAEGTKPQFQPLDSSAGLSLLTKESVSEEKGQQPLLPFRFHRRGPALALGDLNQDGHDDLVLGGSTITSAQLQLHTGASGYRAPTSLSATTGELGDGPVLLFDADGNGTNDILLTRTGTELPAGSSGYQPTLLLNDGEGAFRSAEQDALPALPISTGAAAAADFDRDGLLDVFIGGRVQPGQYPLTPRSALLANRGGKFVDITETVAPELQDVGMVTSALWTDVDDDGWIDLLVSTEWGGIRCWRNREGRSFEDASDRLGFSSAGTGAWTSLAAADFNGDGRMDYAAGNLGLNTPYRASTQFPAVALYGDFKGTGAPLLVEGHYEEGQLYPRQTRSELVALIPAIARRFPKNDTYARATLSEIVGNNRFAAARKFVITELRSGVFLSGENGQFRFEPLPRIAQIAPAQGMVAGDFDGDGKSDLYLVQNSFAPNTSIGNFDGGLSQLLLGDGQGHFRPVSPVESGLVVDGDAKALIVTDIDEDGWPDFIATRNNSPALGFSNTGFPTRRSIRIVLKGALGNSSAIGARVRLELLDGSVRLGEVHAGSGYFSQSSAALFFAWPESNPPRKAEVRWPSGETTIHEISISAPTLILTTSAR